MYYYRINHLTYKIRVYKLIEKNWIIKLFFIFNFFSFNLYIYFITYYHHGLGKEKKRISLQEFL